MPNRDQIPRQLIVADPHVGPDAVSRVSVTAASQTGQQAGLTLQQPEPSTSTLVGDIRPALSGTPEREQDGTLYVAESGGTSTSRWTWSYGDDDLDADFRFRQRPGAIGKRPDVLAYGDTGDPWYNGPEMRELIDGRLALLYMEQNLRFYELDPAVGWTTIFRYSWLDPEDDRWTNPAEAPGLGGWGFTGTEIDAGPYWADFDFVVYPDTGELVAVVVGGYVSTGNPYNPVGAVYYSTDSGATWYMRTRILTEGNNPTFEVSGNAEVFRAVACELTETGRLVVLVADEQDLYALTSDDRGKTFLAEEIDGDLGVYRSTDTSPYNGLYRQALSMRRMRNGTILAYHQRNAVRLSPGDVVQAYFFLTIDGSTWSSVQHDTDNYHELMDVAVCERPDGYPWIYGTNHGSYTPAYSTSTTYGSGPQAILDELVQLAIHRRDPVPTTSIETLCPSGGEAHIHYMHLLVDAGRNGANRPNAPAGAFTTIDTPDPPTIDGFAQLSAVNYRGQVVLAVSHLNDNDSEASMMVYRVDYAQPIQERFVPGADVIGAVTRLLAGYHRTWDCYADPGNWGYSRVTTGGAAAITAPNAEGGYWSTSAAAVQNYWTDTTLPWGSESHSAVVRCVMRINTGGSTTFPEAALLLSLSDGATFAGWVLKLEVDGADVNVQAADVYGADIGAVATMTDGAGEWLELLVGMWVLDTSPSVVAVEAYWRMLDRADDPDWLGGYSQIVSDTLTKSGTGTERLSFGHISASSTATCDWKTVQIWRSPEEQATLPHTPLIQRDFTYVDEESESVRIDRGEFGIVNDSGRYNYLRPMQAIRYPAQFIADGVHVSWRGEAMAAGSIDWETTHTYSGKHLFDQSPPQQEWRSVDDDGAVEIVLDAELVMGAGGLWDADALAIFGKNFHTFRFEMNATDSWGSPDFSVRAGIPGIATPPTLDRSVHLFDAISGVTATITVTDHRCQVVTATAAARDGYTFRPHRFASKETGPRFYAVFLDQPSEGRHAMFRIADNDRDTLTFFEDPISYGISEAAERVCIISDRVAWDLRTRIRAAHATGLRRRFIRLLIETAEHADTDERFCRAGTILLGTATKLGPGIEYGYAVSPASGNTLIQASSGATFRQRDHAQIRTWTLDSPELVPAAEPDAVSNPNIEQGRASWQRVVDLLHRAEINGEMVGLVFDGIAAESSADAAGEQLLVDPFDCAPVRVSNGGQTTQTGYLGRTRPELGGGTHCVPRPVAATRRIALTEVL